MGDYLSKADRTKDTETGGDAALRFCAVGMQGWRRSMEDSHIANITDLGAGISFFGVFDGHGGKCNFVLSIRKNISFCYIVFILTHNFMVAGQEVALFVKKYFVAELAKLKSF